MYHPKLEKDIRCPLEYGLEVFGGKWKARIICVLAEKKVLRYSALRDEMTDIADPVLALALKELVKDDIVERRQFAQIPPKVEYSLTQRGFSVIPILQNICRWSGACKREQYESEPASCLKCDYNGKKSEVNP